MSRPVDAGPTGTLYRARFRRTYTRDDGVAVDYQGAYGPYARPGDARAAIKRESTGAFYRRHYPDFVEVWTVEVLTGDWQEVPSE